MVALSVIIPGTIGTYGDLVDKVAAWLDRDDLVDRIPDFCALAEARFNREFRVLNQETTTSFTTMNPSYTLPGEFRRMKRIWVSGSPTTPLDQIAGGTAPERAYGQTGTPAAYYIDNRVLNFLPNPDGEITFVMTYLSRVKPLSLNNESNWILNEHPDAYLFATLLEAAVYIRDTDAIAYLDPRVSDTIRDINLASRRDAWGAGPISPQGPVQVRGGKC